MSAKRCATCGAAFYVNPADEWKTLCLPCWRRSKRAEERAPAPYWTPVDTKILKLATENAALTAEVERLRAALAEAQAELDPDMLRLLVQLVHPDRHGGSHAATKATAYLNQLRSRANR